jgi:hypothetical protein
LDSGCAWNFRSHVSDPGHVAVIDILDASFGLFGQSRKSFMLSSVPFGIGKLFFAKGIPNRNTSFFSSGGYLSAQYSSMPIGTRQAAFRLSSSQDQIAFRRVHPILLDPWGPLVKGEFCFKFATVGQI